MAPYRSIILPDTAKREFLPAGYELSPYICTPPPPIPAHHRKAVQFGLHGKPHYHNYSHRAEDVLSAAQHYLQNPPAALAQEREGHMKEFRHIWTEFLPVLWTIPGMQDSTHIFQRLFELMDELFFGGALTPVCAVSISATTPPDLVPSAITTRRPYVSDVLKDCEKEVVIILLPPTWDQSLMQDARARTYHYITQLTHQMIHALFSIYSCVSCAPCRRDVAEQEGLTGHHQAFLDVAWEIQQQSNALVGLNITLDLESLAAAELRAGGTLKPITLAHFDVKLGEVAARAAMRPEEYHCWSATGRLH
jgi:hypothetical protein